MDTGISFRSIKDVSSLDGSDPSLARRGRKWNGELSSLTTLRSRNGEPVRNQGLVEEILQKGLMDDVMGGG